MRSSSVLRRPHHPPHLIVIAFVSLLALAGCDMYNTKAPAEKYKAAKTFTPEAKKAVIYVYRSSSFLDATHYVRIYCDDHPLVDCTPGTFIRLVVEPGTHVVRVGCPKQMTVQTKPVALSVTLEAKPAKLYYMELTTGPIPIFGDPRLKLAEEQPARSEIQRCDLLELGLH